MSAQVLLVAPPVSLEPAYPLRLASLATALAERGYVPRGFDLRRAPEALDRWLASTARPAPALVVVESSIRNLHAVGEVVRRTRARLDCPIVVTGTAVALEPARLLDAPVAADVAVTGDPEAVVPALLEAGPDRVAGTCRRSDRGEVLATPGGFLLAEHLPSADRRVFPAGAVRRHPLRPGCRIAAIEASRGCSLSCTLCPVPRCTGGALRSRPVEQVIEEMRRLRLDHGATCFQLEDEQPLLDRAWLSELLAAFRRDLAPDGATLELPNGARADLLDGEVLEEMARSGLARLALGIESGSESVREALGRPIDDGRLRRTIRQARELGMVVTGYLMIGLPHERPRDRRATLVAARSLPVHYAHISIFWPWSPLIDDMSDEMLRLVGVRSAGYLFTYGEVRRLRALAALGDLSLRGLVPAARLLGRWLATGARGGGGW